MSKNDFQYGGWNYHTLQCGMWLWDHDSEFTKWQQPAMWYVALGWHAMEFAQTSAILEFYIWFRFWPYHRSRHVILHHFVWGKIGQNPKIGQLWRPVAPQPYIVQKSRPDPRNSLALGLQHGVNSISLQCIQWPVACSEWGACLTDFDRSSTFRFSGSGIRTIIQIGLKSWSVRPCPDICRHAKFHPNPCTLFWVILLTDRQTNIAGNRIYLLLFVGGK